MTFNSTISVQVKAGATNETQELTLPSFGVASSSVFYSTYSLAALQVQNILGGVTIPSAGLPLKFLFIKSDSPIEISVGITSLPTFNGVPGLYFLEVYPATGQLVKHFEIRANTPAIVSVLFGFD